MQRFIIIILHLISLNIYGQKSEIENLINQIAMKEVPENFENYFLVPKSLEQPKVYDSLRNYQIRKLKMSYNDLPLDLIYKQNKKNTDWKKYNLKNAKYVRNEYIHDQYIYLTSPPTDKNVQFVKYNIDHSEYNRLIKNKKPHTLIVKKKWIWNKKKIWDNKKFYNELIKAWKVDEEQNLEEKVYFQFSRPVFSKDGKYAKVSIFKNSRCKGTGFTALYKNENGIWNKLIEYNKVVSEVSMSHTKCGDISISYNDYKDNGLND
ncbi:hypothetical protein [Flavivirga algicola]|uniref:GLPGLI family protein n=1 Tax=Flavivirga algicola TaxID=2729136 RepID=A0ABX1RYX2_9FLAO|nr:hypothetical protein [Flavivirga algicola]NMH87699.1 hypothetical protein [Flavivirga algicola]